MYPILCSHLQAMEYGYTINSIAYVSYLILGEGKEMLWKEGIATPHEPDDAISSDWRVQLYVDGEIQVTTAPIRLGEAIRLLTDWTKTPHAPEHLAK